MNTVNANAAFTYTLWSSDTALTVKQAQSPLAQRIDTDQDHHISADEIRDYLARTGDGGHGDGDLADITQELRYSLAQEKNPYVAGYHSFASLIQDFDKLAEANPNYVQKVVLGKSPEGRDLVAYKLSEGAKGDTSHKPGVVITGCHHAREWMTVEAPLVTAHQLLDDIGSDKAKQQRLKDSEIWIMPCVNPDGYEYSRNSDNWWRKNRRPLQVDQLNRPTREVGVDLNRNYGDDKPGHEWIFRPASDKPGNTNDDFGATSDNPGAETYRGPGPASEPEVKVLTDLEDKHKNIRACIDYHSYGDDILYPWSHGSERPPHYELYQQIGAKVSAGTGFKLEQSVEMYPNSGSSDEFQEANGMLSFTFEIGRSFQPNPKQIPQIAGNAAKGSLIFIDEVIAHSRDGSLPVRV